MAHARAAEQKFQEELASVRNKSTSIRRLSKEPTVKYEESAFSAAIKDFQNDLESNTVDLKANLSDTTPATLLTAARERELRVASEKAGKKLDEGLKVVFAELKEGNFSTGAAAALAKAETDAKAEVKPVLDQMIADAQAQKAGLAVPLAAAQTAYDASKAARVAEEAKPAPVGLAALQAAEAAAKTTLDTAVKAEQNLKQMEDFARTEYAKIEKIKDSKNKEVARLNREEGIQHQKEFEMAVKFRAAREQGFFMRGGVEKVWEKVGKSKPEEPGVAGAAMVGTLLDAEARKRLERFYGDVKEGGLFKSEGSKFTLEFNSSNNTLSVVPPIKDGEWPLAAREMVAFQRSLGNNTITLSYAGQDLKNALATADDVKNAIAVMEEARLAGMSIKLPAEVQKRLVEIEKEQTGKNFITRDRGLLKAVTYALALEKDSNKIVLSWQEKEKQATKAIKSLDDSRKEAGIEAPKKMDEYKVLEGKPGVTDQEKAELILKILTKLESEAKALQGIVAAQRVALTTGTDIATRGELMATKPDATRGSAELLGRYLDASAEIPNKVQERLQEIQAEQKDWQAELANIDRPPAAIPGGGAIPPAPPTPYKAAAEAMDQSITAITAAVNADNYVIDRLAHDKKDRVEEAREVNVNRPT